MTPNQTPDQPILDGFVYSASMLYLPITYRAHVLAQMEVLRRARGFRCRHFDIPDADDPENPIAAFSQLERQINTTPGSYLWGIGFSAPARLNDSVSGNVNLQVHVQVTDACTETPLYSDYIFASQIASAAPAAGSMQRRNPMLLAQPALIGEPGLIDVEIYNKCTGAGGVGVALTCQVMLFIAEPSVPPEQMRQILEQTGYYTEEVLV